MIDLPEARRYRTLRPHAALLAFLLLPLATPELARATVITVTTTDDENNSDGDCSLREAVRAANLNMARDACPAGQSNATDTIVLQGGAHYALTVAGTDSAAASGDLDVVANTTATELVIQATGNGRAIISQEADPDDRVFDVFPNAALAIEDVEIRGGTSPGSSNGGAVKLTATSSVTLRWCALVGNVAGGNGGAIAAEGGTLVLENTSFVQNVADDLGGAVWLAAGASATIDGASFAENVAGSDGGAITNAGTMSVTGTGFTDNLADRGGAVASTSATPGATAISGSCFVGNADAVRNLDEAEQSATGNWWASPSGPSGEGPGIGDAVSADVDFVGFLATVPDACLPLRLVANGGFEVGDVNPDLPDRWRRRRVTLPDEGRFCTEDGCAAELDGGGGPSQLLQTLAVSGAAGDVFVLSARASAMDVPVGAGKFRVLLQLIHADGSRQSRVLHFTAGSYDFESKSKPLVATEPYVRLKVRAEYGRASGTVRFDDVSVVKQP